MTSHHEPVDVAIIGGGWAGLSAAVNLSSSHRVLVLERAPNLGGRARGIQFGKYTVDNGQHLLIGAYRTLLHFLQQWNIPEHQVLHRMPLTWQIHDKTRTLFTWQLPPKSHRRILHALKTLHSILQNQSLNFRDRLQLIRLIHNVLHHKIDDTLSVEAWLQHAKAPASIAHSFFMPLCLAAMSTPATSTQMTQFQRVLIETMATTADASDLLIPTVDLSQLFPKHAAEHILQNDGIIRTNCAVTHIDWEDVNIAKLHTKHGTFSARHVLIATTSRAAAKLLSSHTATSALATQLATIKQTCITTVYCEYNRPVNLNTPMMGSHNTISQWIFDRKIAGQPNLVAVIITGDGVHENYTNNKLIDVIRAEIAPHIAKECRFVSGKVIREHEAAFICDSINQSKRPSHATPLSNCWLAGDYCQTRFPATLEGALISGAIAAAAIAKAPDTQSA